MVVREEIRVGAVAIRFLVEGEQSAGSVAVFEFDVPAGSKVPAPHSHDGYEETTYGLEGLLTWTIEGAPIDVGPGEAICIPRGAVHGFDNTGDVDAVALAIVTPGMLGSDYFREVGAVLDASAGGPPDLEAVGAVMRRHGLTPASPSSGAANALDDRPLSAAVAEAEPILRRPEGDISILVARDEISLIQGRCAPGEQIAGPHVHDGHTDAFYVLDGELTFEIGRQREVIAVPAGGFVAVPPGVAHSLRNDGERDAHSLTIHAPDGGFAAFMRGRRDGVEVEWDISPVPADGGLSASEAVLSLGRLTIVE